LFGRWSTVDISTLIFGVLAGAVVGGVVVFLVGRRRRNE
jgi:hypothetical protein